MPAVIVNTTHNRKIYFDRSKLLLLIFWAGVQCFYFIKSGIVENGEAEKYIREAHLLIQSGKLSSPNFWLYFCQIFLLSICIKLRISFVFAIAVQLLLNLAATYSFYATLLRISGYPRIAMLGVLLLLINQPYQEFNFYLQTESIFYSLTLLHSSYLLKTQKTTLKSILIIALSSCILMITRPTGLLFIPPTLVYVFLISLRKLSNARKVAVAGFFCFAFFYILDKALSGGGELDLMLPFKNQSVICGVPSPAGVATVNTTANGNSLFGLFYFVTHNFSLFLRLAGQKTLAFFGLWRSYFSAGHNIFLIVYYYPLYILSALSISYWVKTRLNAFLYLTLVVFITWFSVTLTCDDWHNRFFLALSPYFILMSLGFVSSIQKNPPHLIDQLYQ